MVRSPRHVSAFPDFGLLEQPRSITCRTEHHSTLASLGDKVSCAPLVPFALVAQSLARWQGATPAPAAVPSGGMIRSTSTETGSPTSRGRAALDEGVQEEGALCL